MGLAHAYRGVALLLDHKAGVNGHGHNGESPLHEAAKAGHRAMAELLLARGADPKAHDVNRYTPARMAREEVHAALAAFLREKEGRTEP